MSASELTATVECCDLTDSGYVSDDERLTAGNPMTMRLLLSAQDSVDRYRSTLALPPIDWTALESNGEEVDRG